MSVRALAVVALAGIVVSTAAAQPSPPDDFSPLPVIGGVSVESRVEPRFSKVATTIAGRAVDVRCYSTTDWARLDREWLEYVGRGLEGWNGYVSKDARHLMHLNPSVCTRLVALTYKGYRPRDRAGRKGLASALLTLGHEAQHSAGSVSEQTAECRGLQRIRPAARMLGATKDFAAILARVAWLYVYPNQGRTYVSGECRDSGPLDLNPATNIWP